MFILTYYTVYMECKMRCKLFAHKFRILKQYYFIMSFLGFVLNYISYYAHIIYAMNN